MRIKITALENCNTKSMLFAQEEFITCLWLQEKEHAKLVQCLKVAFLFIHTVPVYNFKLVWVVLNPSVKNFLKTIY